MTKAANEVYCSSCGNAIKKEAELCPNCGVRQTASSPSSTVTSTSEEYCKSCGEVVNKDAELCPHCGVRRKGGSSVSTVSNENNALTYLAWGFGILLVLAGIGTFGDGNIFISFIQGIAMIAVGLILLPPVRERIAEGEYQISTNGRVKSVDESPIRDSSEVCSACYSEISTGVERRYAEEFVILGVAVHTFDSGKNTYCETCARGDSVQTAHKETNEIRL